MWSERKLESHLRSILSKEFSFEESENYWREYADARQYLIDEIYREIKGQEPNLTDHSGNHVANVMDRAWDLIEDQKEKFSAIEIYLLCLIIIFHDVGNIEGRGGHNKKIAEIYNIIKRKHPKFNQERRLVLTAAGAHCGQSKSGNKDTLCEVDEIANLYNKKINLREIASILRLSDELAEGPQRTSHYLLIRDKIGEKSKIYHEYASITDIFVDKGNNRLVLNYNIDYNSSESTMLLLRFVYERILKLDFERRYCKYYAPILDKLKKTEATINFTIEGNISNLDLPKIELGDKYNFIESSEDVDMVNSFIKSYPAFNIENIIKKLEAN